jgi:hypothetical protein
VVPVATILTMLTILLVTLVAAPVVALVIVVVLIILTSSLRILVVVHLMSHVVVTGVVVVVLLIVDRIVVVLLIARAVTRLKISSRGLTWRCWHTAITMHRSRLIGLTCWLESLCPCAHAIEVLLWHARLWLLQC